MPILRPARKDNINFKLNANQSQLSKEKKTKNFFISAFFIRKYSDKWQTYINGRASELCLAGLKILNVSFFRTWRDQPVA